jgi:hypothetical protein
MPVTGLDGVQDGSALRRQPMRRTGHGPECSNSGGPIRRG